MSVIARVHWGAIPDNLQSAQDKVLHATLPSWLTHGFLMRST